MATYNFVSVYIITVFFYKVNNLRSNLFIVLAIFDKTKQKNSPTLKIILIENYELLMSRALMKLLEVFKQMIISMVNVLGNKWLLMQLLLCVIDFFMPIMQNNAAVFSVVMCLVLIL